MSISQLLHGPKSASKGVHRPRRHLGSSRRPPARELRFEPLECRALLTSFVVDSPLDDPSAGAGDTDGLVSLREAVTAANTNLPFGDAPAGEGGDIVDQITFDPWPAEKPIILGGVELTITDGLSITGLEADQQADQLAISGNSASRVFSIEDDVNVSISDVAIVDGSAYEGGGIYNKGTLTIANSSFLNNSAARHGGGIHNVGGTVIITDSEFSENSAVGSGATGGAFSSFIHLTGSDGRLQITGSTFSGNSASSGAAIWNDMLANIADSTFSENTARGSGGAISNRAATMTITSSSLVDNSSDVYGGAIDNWGATVILKDSTISGNSAGSDGGAIENDDATVELTNSTLSGNSAGRFGGAIDNWGGTVESTNSTIVMNRADADGNGSGTGGGIYNYNASSVTLLNNTLLAGNLLGAAGSDSPNDLTGVDLDLASSHNLIGDAVTSGGLSDGDHGNIVGDGGSGTIDITTVLDPNLADNGGPTLTHALVASSPAIDAGKNSLAVDRDGNSLVYDQRGADFARVIDGSVDIGAYEVQPQNIEIEIDVKPGSDSNPINLASQGVIAVAIFTTDDFDASLVDASTVVFAGASAVHSALEDTDGDGDLDLILHFRTQETNLADLYALLLADDNEDGILDSNHQTAAVSLTGRTTTDEYFEAFDDVDLFLSGKNLRDFLEDLVGAGVI